MSRHTFSLNLPKFLKAPFQLSLLMSSASALILLIAFFRLQPTVPIFYSLATSADYLADKKWLILFPAFSFLMTIGHLFLIRLLYKHEKIIPILFAWCTIALQLILLMELIRIILIVS